MATNRLSGTGTDDNPLGTYLKACRARLDPAAYDISKTRRRTPELRREEVAQRAGVSATWYTWLEQGRGGTPSAAVLEQIAEALALTAVEREHLFLLAQHRPPEVYYRAAEEATPRLQRVIDALELSPAYLKTSTWDVVAWNRAAAAVLTDYGALLAEQRNILRLFFRDPDVRTKTSDWESEARFMVAAFRAEAARTGALMSEGQALVDELSGLSAEFRAMWHDNEVRTYGEGSKCLRHPLVGVIALEYSAFAVDGQPDLGMVIYTPTTLADDERISSLVGAQTPAST